MNTNSKPIDFSDLEDSEMWDSKSPVFVNTTSEAAKDLTLGSGKSVATIARFTCDACNGTKVKWYGYRPETRTAYPCPKCKGVGMLKTSPEVRKAAKQSREDAKQQALEDWKNANSEVVAWLTARNGKSNFATSLCTALVKYGSLTDGQVQAVKNIIEKDKEAQLNKPVKVADVKFEEIGFTRLVNSFQSALASKLKRPKLHIGSLVFSLAAATSTNAGSIYIKNGETYLGKISTTGEFFKSRECEPTNTQQVEEIAKDPLAAIVTHGKQTGMCACCGRELENEESVSLGIGPICRKKWGLE